LAAALAALLAIAGSALADTAAEPAAEAGWAAMAAPGAVALMRHARAPGTGDPPGFVLGDCATQRNLDDAGRAQARATGDAFRARGIAVDRVLSSRWCRALETARLAELGPVEPAPAFDSFFEDRAEGPARTAAAGALLRGLPPEARVLVVTHQVNISALAGVVPASGEIVVGRMGPEGFETLGRIPPP
jgi:broad specificity phosphatase PhoE